MRRIRTRAPTCEQAEDYTRVVCSRADPSTLRTLCPTPLGEFDDDLRRSTASTGDIMAHRTFFSFHYEKDVWRATNVRNSSKLKPSITPEWIEASIWETAKTKGEAAVKKLIDDGLVGTTVTAVLIGSETASRKWVQYEIDASIERDNGLIGIYIHNIKDTNQKTATKGANPLPAGYPTYDWVNNVGHTNLGKWVDDAYDAR